MWRILSNKYFIFSLLLIVCLLGVTTAEAQCSICTRTAQQLGEKPAQGLNAGILYLAFAPLAIVGVVAYRWWQREKTIES
ncbi:MAG TPA: hypothetical protein VNS32_24900 [Flavisolibacter sp.]|nr:hypothetical protein [Flavisolibacter sp.]